LLDFQRGALLEDPAPSWRYAVIWPTLPGFDGKFVQDNIVAETVSVPFKGVNAIGRHAGATIKYFPDFMEIQSFSSTFYLDQYHRSLNYFLIWKELIADPSGNFNETDKFKQDLNINIFSYDDSNQNAVTMKLFGVWPTEVTALEFSYENSDRLKLDVQFSLDSSQVEFLDTEGTGNSGIGGVIQTGQRILRTGRRGLREITDIARIF
jgi:hypothetical protein